MSKKHLAEHADRVARSLEEDAIRQMRLILINPLTYINAVVEADFDKLNDQTEFDRRIRSILPPREYGFIQAFGDTISSTPGEDAIQMTKWARNRVIYVIDPDAADAIQNTEWGNTVIPGEVLRRLPHTNPFIALPRPFRVPTTEGHVEKYEGFIVLGVRPDRKRGNSDDPDNVGLVLHFLGRLVDKETDKPITAELPQFTTGQLLRTHQVVGMRVLTSLEDMTMAQRQEYAAKDIQDLGGIAQIGFLDENHALTVTKEMTAMALSLLVYLVTDDSDTQKVRLSHGSKRERKAKTGGNASSGSTIVEVGFRVGAALREASRGTSESHNKTGEKRTVAPHIRRAHIHTFRRGKGREERFLKWLPPLAINAKKGVNAEKSQVHFR